MDAPSYAPATRPSPAVWAVIGLLFALALGLRIGYLHTTQVDTPIRADAKEYATYAQNLVDHGVYSKQAADPPKPDSFRSPGYPLFLAGVLWLCGPQNVLEVSLHLQAILSALMVPLAFLLGRRFVPDAWALVPAAMVCLSPHLISACGYLLTEATYAFFLLLGIWMMQKGLEEARTRWAIGSALAYGVAWSLNETALIFAPLLVLVHLFVASGRAAWWNPARTPALALLAVFALFPIAWNTRNAMVLDEDALRGSQRALATMTHGSYPNFMWQGRPQTRPYPYRFDPEQPEISFSWSRFWSVFARRVREAPAEHAQWFFLGKPATLWSWNLVQGQGDIYVYPVRTSMYESFPAARATHTLMRWLHLPTVLLAAAGACGIFLRRVLGRRGPADGALSLSLCLLAATALFTIFAPWPRYAVPLRPALYLMATTTVWFAWARIAKSSMATRRGARLAEASSA